MVKRVAHSNHKTKPILKLGHKRRKTRSSGHHKQHEEVASVPQECQCASHHFREASMSDYSYERLVCACGKIKFGRGEIFSE